MVVDAMTLDELLEASPDKLKALTEKDLEKHLEHYFCVTRPEMVAERGSNKGAVKVDALKDPRLAKMEAMLDRLGIKL